MSYEGYTAIEGVSHGIRGKAIKFQGDFWDEPKFIPLSQSKIEGNDEDGERCTLYIKDWLVEKEGLA